VKTYTLKVDSNSNYFERKAVGKLNCVPDECESFPSGDEPTLSLGTVFEKLAYPFFETTIDISEIDLICFSLQLVL
jgi:hypothetical protein